MASPAVDSDLARPVSPYPLSAEDHPVSTSDRSQTLRSMGDLLRSIHGDQEEAEAEAEAEEEEEAAAHGRMTLEEFLARAWAVKEEDASVSSETPVLGFGTEEERRRRRRRKWTVLDPINDAAMRRQRRMIKNRESAARSRERKQAYTLELESLAARLEEENARLLKEREELKRLRLEEIKESTIPAAEKRTPARPSPLRRTQSSTW